MKITRRQLRKIIKEIRKVGDETDDWGIRTSKSPPEEGHRKTIGDAELQTFIEGTLDSHPDTFTFDQIVDQFEQYYSVPKRETQEMLQRYIDDGFIIINSDDTLRII